MSELVYITGMFIVSMIIILGKKSSQTFHEFLDREIFAENNGIGELIVIICIVFWPFALFVVFLIIVLQCLFSLIRIGKHFFVKIK